MYVLGPAEMMCNAQYASCTTYVELHAEIHKCPGRQLLHACLTQSYLSEEKLSPAPTLSRSPTGVKPGVTDGDRRTVERADINTPTYHSYASRGIPEKGHKETCSAFCRSVASRLV